MLQSVKVASHSTIGLINSGYDWVAGIQIEMHLYTKINGRHYQKRHSFALITSSNNIKLPTHSIKVASHSTIGLINPGYDWVAGIQIELRHYTKINGRPYQKRHYSRLKTSSSTIKSLSHSIKAVEIHHTASKICIIIIYNISYSK